MFASSSLAFALKADVVVVAATVAAVEGVITAAVAAKATAAVVKTIFAAQWKKAGNCTRCRCWRSPDCFQTTEKMKMNAS